MLPASSSPAEMAGRSVPQRLRIGQSGIRAHLVEAALTHCIYKSASGVGTFTLTLDDWVLTRTDSSVTTKYLTYTWASHRFVCTESGFKVIYPEYE